ncbi:MAG TPA: hypothetical protein VJB67_00515 [Patescibacteria group bacterium]|nr:hypothetical protein [Patescibacteria group bacterium]
MKRLAGITKGSNGDRLHPRRIIDVYNEQGRRFTDEEFNRLYGITEDDSVKVMGEKMKDPQRTAVYDMERERKLSDDEIKEINRNISLTRDDVKTMADRVVEKVWGFKKGS